MTGHDVILPRIARDLGGEPVVAALRALPPRDLNSLLLHLFAARASAATPRDLLERYERAGLFKPSFANPRVSARFLDAAFEAAEGFEAVELSPMAPLGAGALLSGVHPNNVLSASRGAEVLADPTLAMALECALRRRAGADGVVRLCASQRVVRMQPVPVAGLLPHFRLFALVTAARRAPGFESVALREHLATHLRLFRALRAKGFALADVTVDVSNAALVERLLTGAGVDVGAIRRTVRTHHFEDADARLARLGVEPLRGALADVLPRCAALPRPMRAWLDETAGRVLAPLAGEFPEATVRFDLSRLEGLGYYPGACVRLSARDPGGASFQLGDGGFTPWTARLLGDGRERLLTTGVGSDLVCARFFTGP